MWWRGGWVTKIGLSHQGRNGEWILDGWPSYLLYDLIGLWELIKMRCVRCLPQYPAHSHDSPKLSCNDADDRQQWWEVGVTEISCPLLQRSCYGRFLSQIDPSSLPPISAFTFLWPFYHPSPSFITIISRQWCVRKVTSLTSISFEFRASPFIISVRWASQVLWASVYQAVKWGYPHQFFLPVTSANA